jgi:hypothetical protein
VLTLNPGKVFNSICKEVDRYTGAQHSKQNDPHISLLYSHLDCNQLTDKVLAVRKKIPEIVEICALAMVELQGGPGDWKILVKKNF